MSERPLNNDDPSRGIGKRSVYQFSPPTRQERERELRRLREGDVVKFDVKTLQYLEVPREWLGGYSWVDAPDYQRINIVYFVQALSGGPIKIGWTGYYRLKGRLTGIQNGNPERLCVRAIVVGGQNVEKALHIEFAEHRLVGEWFTNVPELARVARAMSSDGRDYMMDDSEAAVSEPAFSGPGPLDRPRLKSRKPARTLGGGEARDATK